MLLTAQGATARPDAPEGAHEPVTPVSRHGRLHDLERLPQRRHLEHVQPGAQQQVRELDGLPLQLLRLGRSPGGGGVDGDHGSFVGCSDGWGP